MVATPAQPDLDPVYQAAGQEWDIDPSILKAVAGQESGGTVNPNTAVSPAGARGKMQLMPDTAAAMGVTDTSDPVQSIWGGAKYLSGMRDRYGSMDLGLAAYNAGPGRLEGYTDKTTGQHVPGWLQLLGDPRTGAISPQDFVSRIPIQETANYVPGVARKYAAITANAGGQPPPVASGPDPSLTAPPAASGSDPSLTAPPPSAGSWTPTPSPSPADPTLPAAPPPASSGSPPLIPPAQHGNNMPLLSTGYGAGGFGSALRVVIGDSLGVGMMQSGNLPGIAQGSIPPSVVLARLNALPDGALSGRQVVISTGLSNSGSTQQQQADLPLVQQQVDAARSRGAASVVLAGVGDTRFPGVNDGIRGIAQRSGALFTGAAPTADAAGVHPGPAGYRAMLAAAPFTPSATQQQPATPAALRQPGGGQSAPAASPAPGAAIPAPPPGGSPFDQAMQAATAASAAPAPAAQPAPLSPFDQAMQAVQAASSAPTSAPGTPLPSSRAATPASAVPSPPNGASAPGGAPAATDPFSMALAAAQTASAAPGAQPGRPNVPNAPAPPPVVSTEPHLMTEADSQTGIPWLDAARAGIGHGVMGIPTTLARPLNSAASYLGLDGQSANAALSQAEADYQAKYGNSTAAQIGDIVGNVASTAGLLKVGALGAGLAGRAVAGVADAVSPTLGTVLRTGGRLVSGTASVPDNAIANAVVRGGSLATNGAVQGAAVNLLTGNADPTTNLLTGAGVGAVLGPVATGVGAGIGAGWRAAQGLWEPFTTKGQGAIADRALASLAARGGSLTPDTTTYVPGSTPTLAQATNNAGLASAERAVASARPGPFANQAAINSDARDAQLASITRTPTDIEAAQAARDATAVPAITNPIANATGPANGQPVVDTIDSILASPAGQRDAVQSALGNIRSKLVSPAAPFPSRVSDALNPITDAIANGGQGDAGLWAARDALVAAQKGTAAQASTVARLSGTTSPDPAYQALIDQATSRVGATSTVQSDPAQLYGIRKAIGDALSPLAARTGSDAQLATSELQQVKAAIDNSIEGVAPGFKSGLADYADSSRPIDAMRYLQGKNYTAADGSITMAKVKGALDDITRQQALPGPRDAKSIPAATVDSLQSLYADLLRQNNSRTGMSIGSNTFQNLATSSTLSNLGAPIAFMARTASKVPFVGNMLTNGITKAYEGQNDAVMNAVVNRLLNPTAGASVLEEAGKLQARRAAGPSGVNLLVNPLGLGVRNAVTGPQQP